MTRKRGDFTDSAAGKFVSPLANALATAGVTVSPGSNQREQPTPLATPPPPAGVPDLRRCRKVVLRREKKGRGGKTVTVVTGLVLPAAQLDELSRQLRKALGCGSTVEDGNIVLQGDMTARAETWLRRHGVERVVQGTQP